MKKQFISITGFLLLCTGFLIANGCASHSPKSIAPHINLSPENMQLAVDSDKGLDFGMEVEGNESDTLDNLEVLPGIRIRSIRPAGSAEKAGLKRGDIILSINDIKINHPDTLVTISETSKSDQFVFMVRRDTTVFEVTLQAPKAEKAADPEERYRADPLKTRAGFRTEIVKLGGKSSESTVARIVQLWPDTPFTKSGIEVGDAVVSVDNTEIESAQGLINLLTNNYEFGDDAVFTILKKGTSEPKNIKVTLWDPGRIATKYNIWPLFMYEAKPESDKEKFSVLNFWIISLFTYERDESERSYSILRFIRFRSDNRGELVDQTNTSEK